jgi:hypothetical protein
MALAEKSEAAAPAGMVQASKYRNAYEQLTEDTISGRTQLDAVGLLVGVDTPGPSFRNYLRDIPPLAEDWTMGDMARAYLRARLAALEAKVEA